MTREEKRAADQTVLEGFGVAQTVKYWREDLGIGLELFNYLTRVEGLTIESIYETLKRTYQSPEENKPKGGARMRESLGRLKPIFSGSGYDPELLTVEYRPGAPVHTVKFNGCTVGRYYYKECRLVMLTGEGVFLDRLEPEKIKVQNYHGGWVWHPDTRAALIDSLINR